MFYSFKLGKALDLCLLLCLGFAAFLLVSTAQRLSAVQTDSAESREYLVIDPGHGGIDGGAIAFNGTKESDINLAIARKLQALAEFFGVPTIMTRIDDSRRTDPASYSEHEDLVHRTELINAVPRAVLISIHQNCYPTSQPSGAQVLYAASERSRSLGERAHTELVIYLQPENRRLAEPAPEKLYITSHVRCPAILVECGFLSNLTDLQNLEDDSYQTSLSAVLMHAYWGFHRSQNYT